MARYVVTGGCGFIGSHLVDRLIADGHDVHVLDDLSTGRVDVLPPGVALSVADVADAKTVARLLADADGCFHLAAVASVERANRDWLGTHRTNQTGTITVLDAARRGGRTPVPVVYASSAAVYGACPDTPLTEAAPTRPLSAYGADKLGCERHALVAGHVHGVPTTGLRFFNVYGPRQDPRSPYSGVISIFAERLLTGRPLAIHGDGRQVRDFVYVEDVVSCLIAGMANASTEARVFNVCTGRPTAIRDLADTLARLSGRPARLHPGPARAGDIRESLGDPDGAAAGLGVRCATPLDAGLGRTLAWIRSGPGTADRAAE
jgi:UDP-glucose 4-epimerase